MADRYAGFFLPATLAVAGLAWGLSGDAVRALAVVVVATPCPLILAAPIALVSGLSRAARAGIIVKGAGAIETLGAGAHGPLRQDRHAHGRHPRGARDHHARRAGAGELLRLAASVDRLSAHVLGQALVAAADRCRPAADAPDRRHEEPGQGIRGIVDGRDGRGRQPRRSCARWACRRMRSSPRRLTTTRGSGEAHVVVAVDGHVAGVIVMADELRPDADRIVERLRSEGIRHVAMISGDRRSVAERVGARARRRPRLRRAVTGGQARGRASHRRRPRACAR